MFNASDFKLPINDTFPTSEAWIDNELQGCSFKDERLASRFKMVLHQLNRATAESIPWACQDWANTKAAYRFLDNDRVSDSDILGGHFCSTRRRFAHTSGMVLVLQDTTEFSYQRDNIGLLHNLSIVRNRQRETHPICGLSMHSSLAVTTDGLPLGLAAARFWTRSKFKGTNALKRKINPTRVPIEQKESMRWLLNLRESSKLLGEPERCVHVGDRESDIFELFCEAQEAGTHFLVRTCVDRLVDEGHSSVAKEMNLVPVKGLHHIEIPDSKGKLSTVVLELKYRRLHIRAPIGKQANYPPLNLTVIHAVERNAPTEREPIVWKLLTDLPVSSNRQAIEKLHWYALRWKIEVFHKILKSGCKVESSGLRTAPRLTRLIASCCIIAWRIFWMTMINRTKPKAAASIALTADEIKVLNLLSYKKNKKVNASPTLSDYIIQIAKLGGYIARARDPAPGNTVMWRGLNRLTDFMTGFSLHKKIVGN